MTPLDRKPKIEMINVHQVHGDREAIIFLKNAEHNFVEGLFYKAKRFGQTDFYWRDTKYDIIRNRDFSFTINPSPDQGVTTEQFA